MASALSNIAKDFRHISNGISSFIKIKNIYSLSGTLSKSMQKKINLQEELEHHENNVNKMLENRQQLAHDLLREERIWKNSLQDAEKKKEEAVAAYSVILVKTQAEVNRTKESIKSLPEEIHALNHQDAEFVTFTALESQMVQLKEAKEKIMSAKNEIEFIKNQSSGISDLSKKLQQAKDHHYHASSQYHSTRDILKEVNKHIVHVHQLTNNISKTEGHVMPQILRPRFWLNSIQAFTLGSRH